MTSARTAVARRAETVGTVQQNGGQAAPTLQQQIERMKPEMARVLPEHMDADRMARIALTLLRKNPDLAACTAESFLGALMTCSQLGMEPGPQQEAYIVPRKGEAEFQLGYQGMVSLFYRHPLAASLTVETVHANDHFEHEEGLYQNLVHRPCKDGPRGPAIAYYSVARLTNGGATFKVMYSREVEEHRQKHTSPKSRAWQTSYDEMAKKTVLRRHFKALPKSVELALAMAYDGTVRTDATPDAIDVLPEYLSESTPAALPSGQPNDAEMGWPETAQAPAQ